MCAGLEKRREHSENPAEKPYEERNFFVVFSLHFMAGKPYALKVPPDFFNFRIFIQDSSAFKMMVKASVVKVYRAYRGN